LPTQCSLGVGGCTWYYEHPYPPGAKSYNKTKPIDIAEFAAEKAWWGSEADAYAYAARTESTQAWRVPIAEVPNAVASLRKVILQLTVRGNLTARGLDESVIRTHLQALVAAGRARTEGQRRGMHYIAVG
jgi:hypothetical protein